MQTKTLRLKDLTVRNNVFISPMAGFTDYAFRRFMIEFGAGLTFTELTSAKGIVYGSKGNEALLYTGDNGDEAFTAAQIFGSDPYYMRKACESEELEKFKIVDINMGCPVPKVYKNGEGCALLNNITLAESVVKECVKSGKIITVKIRTGMKRGDDVAAEFARMAESSGASLVTVHGRVRESYYSGEPDYNAIARAKAAVTIPLIANGGIFTEEDARLMIDRTGADGVMLARGAVNDPFLVAKLTGTLINLTLKEFIIEHVKLRESTVGGRRAAVEFRKYVSCYFKGYPNAKELKTALLKAESSDEIIKLIEENL